jgi:MFS family permease
MFEGGFLVHNQAGFIVAFFAHTVISGSLFTAWASLTQRLLPRGNFAVINSAGGILGSITGIFFAPIVGRFLDMTHHDYHYTFFINAELTLATLIAFYAVHRRFMALGGPKNYVAPE